MAAGVRLWRRSRELWTKKNDRIAHDYWKRILKPAIGRSLKRAEAAVWLLDSRVRNSYFCISQRPPEKVLREIRRAIQKVSKDMQKYETVVGANITLGCLYHLAVEHRQKITRRRVAK